MNQVKKGKVISFMNMKGGVGKTTLCLSIGEYLANHLSKSVLFIDLDPQFNTTQSLMSRYNQVDKYFNDYVKYKNIRLLFKDQTSLDEEVSNPSKEDVIIELDKNMHLIAGNINIILDDNSKEKSKFKKVGLFIEDNNLREDYDFIFVDCPPTISLYTDSALYASDYYLVPVRMDIYSTLGIKLLNQVITSFSRTESKKIEPLGIVYTGTERPTKLNRKYIEQKDLFEKDKNIADKYVFSQDLPYSRLLITGKKGNFASEYEATKLDIFNLCNEFLERVDQIDREKASN